MSDYFRQNGEAMSFDTKSSWTVLSSIEQKIKNKIEKAGVPLKDWKISIYRGILTGFNDAFIITKETRDKIIADSPKNAEIIRPILRGRDVQKYRADWQSLYIIASHNGYINSQGEQISPVNIDKYPVIKQHLEKYWNEIRKRQDQGITPYNLRSCVYMDDFFRPKIVYPNMTKFLPFYYDTFGYYTNQKCFIITGENIPFLTAFLNSSLFKFCFKENFPELQGGTRELSKIFFDKIPVIKITKKQSKVFELKVTEIQKLKIQEKDTLHLEKEIDQLIFDLYELTPEERQAIGFIDII
jgi:adenine-specific DNA-methyltransferase